MKTNTTTIYDLKKSALTCAEACVDVTTNQRKDTISVQSTQLESFAAAGHDRADFDIWQTFANEFITNVIVWRTTLSPAAIAEKQTAS